MFIKNKYNLYRDPYVYYYYYYYYSCFCIVVVGGGGGGYCCFYSFQDMSIINIALLSFSLSSAILIATLRNEHVEINVVN